MLLSAKDLNLILSSAHLVNKWMSEWTNYWRDQELLTKSLGFVKESGHYSSREEKGKLGRRASAGNCIKIWKKGSWEQPKKLPPAPTCPTLWGN